MNRILRRSFSKLTTTSCWSCSQSVKCCTYFCPSCNKVLKPSEETESSKCSHFDLLGLPVSFGIDGKQLETKFKQLQMNLHPDKFANTSKFEQELSAIHSSRLNEAYYTLKSPVRRALYMLKQKGVDPMNEANTETDLEILTEAMQFRENLEKCKSIDEIESLRSKILSIVKGVEQELAAAIGDTSQITNSVRIAVRMRYLEKVLQEIDDKVRNL